MIGIPQFLSHMAYVSHPDRIRESREEQFVDDPAPVDGGQAAPVGEDDQDDQDDGL